MSRASLGCSTKGANAPDPSEIDFSRWNEQIEKLAASYFKAVPTGKFVMMIPCSICGIPDNTAGDFTIKQNACMRKYRKNIIERFGRRETENIFIVDGAMAIDNQNGYRFINDSAYTKPYSDYQSDASIAVQTGHPHPYLNYPAMGVSLAAFIQRYRK